jgi:hypothetical protein
VSPRWLGVCRSPSTGWCESGAWSADRLVPADWELEFVSENWGLKESAPGRRPRRRPTARDAFCPKATTVERARQGGWSRRRRFWSIRIRPSPGRSLGEGTGESLDRAGKIDETIAFSWLMIPHAVRAYLVGEARVGAWESGAVQQTLARSSRSGRYSQARGSAVDVDDLVAAAKARQSRNRDRGIDPCRPVSRGCWCASPGTQTPSPSLVSHVRISRHMGISYCCDSDGGKRRCDCTDGLFEKTGAIRVGVLAGGAALLFGYGVSLNLTPLPFERVVGCISPHWPGWQVIGFFTLVRSPAFQSSRRNADRGWRPAGHVLVWRTFPDLT